jgi:hypothetical protein
VQTYKQLVSEELNLSENWKSPGGEVKLFISGSLSLKWQGRPRNYAIQSDFSFCLKNICIPAYSFVLMLRCRLAIRLTQLKAALVVRS